MTGSRRETISIDVLRQSVATAAETTSLRNVAAEIGVSVSGLHSFLAGGSPYASTIKKLSAWFIRAQSMKSSAVSYETARACLDLLTDHLKDPEAGKQAILGVLRNSSADSKRTPAWLRKLAKEV